MLSDKKIKRTKTPEQALASLMRICARAEKSSGDALRLMGGWGVDESARRKVLGELIRLKFIDDDRYARAFVREKTRLSGWGSYKIRSALQRKGITAETISDALAETNKEESTEKLHALLRRKAANIKYATKFELKTKLIRYGLSLGHDYENVICEASKIADTEQCDDFSY